MRIAYIASGFPTFSETFVVREAVEVQSLGHDVQVYSLKNRVDPCCYPPAERIVRSTEYSPFFLSRRLLWANVKTALRHPVKYWGTLLFVLLHGLRTPIECLKSLVAFPKTIYYGTRMAARGVEHVHAHFANIPTLSALIIKRIWGIPYSFTCHAHDLFVFRSMLAEKLRGAEFAVAISEYNRRFLARFCAAEDMPKVHVIHCGADVEKLAGTPRAPQLALIVSVARLTPMKGLDVLIEACALLKRRGLVLEFIIGGEGESRPALETLVRKLGLEGTVKLPGLIPAEEVPRLISRAACFVLPAVRAPDGSMDGIPVSLMEAMAVGVPVVSTPVSGIPELVRDGETGLMVEPGDAAVLAEAIAKILEDAGLAARLAAGGRDLVRSEFDLRRNARRLAELIEQHGRTRAHAGAAGARAPAPE